MAIFPFRQKDKEDIPKDAPKKTGFALVFSTLWREFFGLLKLNLVFLLSCLGIVTIPASLKAMSAITIRMVKDENYYLWRDYWAAFKDDFGKSLVGGILYFFLAVAFGVSTYFYFVMGQNVHWFFIVLVAFSAVLFLWNDVASCYFYPMNAYVTLKTGQLLKNSFILVFPAWKRSGLALLSQILFLGVGIFLLPYSAPYMLLIAFPLTHLMVTFALYPVIEKRTAILLNEPAEKSEEEEHPYLQSATFKGWDDEQADPDKKENENAEQ